MFVICVNGLFNTHLHIKEHISYYLQKTFKDFYMLIIFINVFNTTCQSTESRVDLQLKISVYLIHYD